MSEHDPAPSISPARYAKGKTVAHCPPNGSGMKTRAMRLAEALGGRWVNRSRGYVMSPRRAQELVAKHAAGWDASFISRKLEPPDPTPAQAMRDKLKDQISNGQDV